MPENSSMPGFNPQAEDVTPEGYQPTSRDSMGIAVATVIRIMYGNRTRSEKPASSMIPRKTQRNQEIVRRYLAGERVADLATEFGISIRRVNRLIHRYLNRGQE
jgi:DNA-directed RNA polymerase specialized sigma24 family protein